MPSGRPSASDLEDLAIYEYRATVTRVVDADSVRVSVDLGFSTWIVNMNIRLDGLDAPELPTPEGQSAKTALRLLVEGKDVILRTRKDLGDKYGRFLGVLVLLDGMNVNEYLIDHGFARPYFGGKRE